MVITPFRLEFARVMEQSIWHSITTVTCELHLPPFSHLLLICLRLPTQFWSSLRYRYSKWDVATQPRTISWRPDIFSATLDCLPGIPSTHKPLRDVTYPRFGFLGENMFFSHRDGKAGLGNDHLYIYNGKDGCYEYIGPYLTGVQSSPYVNGMTSRDGVLYVTWVYRGFVEYPGWDDPLDTKHKQQAGPNGAENNHNICYAYSDADGYVWKNGCGEVIADLRDPAKFPTGVRGKERTIKNDCSGMAAFDIPKGKGLMNQEAQAVDQEGGVHVLNRDMMNEGGTYLWKHYYRSPDGKLLPCYGFHISGKAD